MAKIKVVLKKGLAGKSKKNKKTVEALGLRKIGDTNVFEKNSAIDGMVKRVAYLLHVEEQ